MGWTGLYYILTIFTAKIKYNHEHFICQYIRCGAKKKYQKGESIYYIAPRVSKQPVRLPIGPM